MQGGVGAYSKVLAHTFAEQGHEVFVLSSVWAHSGEIQAGFSAPVHLTNTVNRWNIGSLWALRQWASKHLLDVVNLQFETAAFGMSPWIHFLPHVLGNIPVVTTFHDLLFPYLFPKAGPLRDWIVMHLARASDGVIATNHEDMMRLEHLPNARLIPIGSNILTELPSDYNRAAWRAKAGVEDKGYLIAHFGFINKSKGVETLLKALAKLRSEGHPFRLVMIGGRTGTSDHSNAPYAEHIDKMIVNMGLEPFIHWTGFVKDEDVTAYLKATDFVVLPFRDGASYRRGSLMAAIRHGCAIVTTTPQVEIPTFQNRENMLLFPPGDTKALVRTIKQLMTDSVLNYHIITGAVALNREFDWEGIAQSCVLLFERVRNKS